MKQPVRVLFDASSLLSSQSGVGFFTEGLISSLAQHQGDDLELTGYYFNFLGRKRPSFNLPSSVHLKPVRFFPGIFLPLLARRFGWQVPIELLVWRKYDFHLFPNFVSLPTLRKTPSLLAVHDLGCYDHPEFVQEKNLVYLQKLLRPSIRRSSGLLTISAFTKQRLEHYFPNFAGRITIAHIPPPAHQPKRSSLPQTILSKGIKAKHYLLYVGTIEPRKNLVNLIKAYRALPDNLRSTYSLVLVGGKGWRDETILSAITEAQAAGLQVIQTGYVTNAEKAALYSNATCFVLPSVYEGFGMPVLEAAAYNLPVAVSDIPVLHEVAGDSALYFDPKNPNSIAKALEKLLTSGDLRRDYARRSRQNLQRFDWQNVAHEVAKTIQEITAEKEI